MFRPQAVWCGGTEIREEKMDSLLWGCDSHYLLCGTEWIRPNAPWRRDHGELLLHSDHLDSLHIHIMTFNGKLTLGSLKQSLDGQPKIYLNHQITEESYCFYPPYLCFIKKNICNINCIDLFIYANYSVPKMQICLIQCLLSLLCRTECMSLLCSLTLYVTISSLLTRPSSFSSIRRTFLQ